MKRVTIICALFGLLISCNNSDFKDNRGKEITSSLISNEQSQKELEESLQKIREEEEAKEKLQKESQTTLKFDKTAHHFGIVKPEVENTTTFKVTNTGDKPLIIESVEASCGCTTPKKPSKPILPNQTDEITVTFKANQGQTGDQRKSVTVIANTEERVHTLEIMAVVK